MGLEVASVSHRQTLPQCASTESGCCMTTAMIKKVALGFFAAVAIVGGLTAIGCAVLSWPVAFIAIPCFVLGGLAIWGLCRIKDYDNPKSLIEFRQDACKKSLEQIASEHGWEKMFQYGIPTPADFPGRYRATVRDYNLNRALDFYERVQSEYQAYRQGSAPNTYQIPHPRELRDKWEQEIAGKKVAEILRSYDIERLARVEILEAGSKELAALRDCSKKYATIATEYKKELNRIEGEYQKQTAPLRAQLSNVQQAVGLAQETEQRRRFERDMQRIEHARDASLQPHNATAQMRVTIDNYRLAMEGPSTQSQRILSESERLFEQQIGGFKYEAERQKDAADKKFQEECAELDQHFRALVS